MKYQTQNGWTKESMLAHVKAEFKGKSESKTSPLCLYRGPKGKKCAVGMFIPDEFYNDKIEGLGVGLVPDEVPELLMLFPLELEPLRMLQGIHDGSHPDMTLKEMLQWIEKHVE